MTTQDGGQLLRFRVANHRSIRAEVELSMMASRATYKKYKGKARVFMPAQLKEPVSTVAVVYGANASGKTNLFSALQFMRNAVVNSHRSWQSDQGVPCDGFAFSGADIALSRYVVDVHIDQVRYEYGFEVTPSSITREWLHSWPNGKRQQWFSRSANRFEFGEKLLGPNRTIQELTRTNSLFLSVAAQNNHAQLKKLFDWFASKLSILIGGQSGSQVSGGWWRKFIDGAAHDLEKQRALTLLNAADVGISDFRVKEENYSDTDLQMLRALEQTLQQPNLFPSKQLSIEFQHSAVGDKNGWLENHRESTGTKLLVSLLPTLLSTLAQGSVMVVDELNSLHPMIAQALIELFQDFSRNPHHGQLLFNTHDPSLLGTMNREDAVVSRDQVWLVEKDAAGATAIHSLLDYAPREHENLERGYLQGRYGGVPFPRFDTVRITEDKPTPRTKPKAKTKPKASA